MIWRAKRITGRGSSNINSRGLLRTKPAPKYPDNWEEIRKRVFERDGYACRRCGCSLRGMFHREVHHITPISAGGTHALWNLVSLCGECHKKQHQHL